MTDKQYLQRMVSLMKELERSASAEPYDPDAYNDILAHCQASYYAWYHNRHRPQYFAFASCIGLLIVLLLIVWKVLSVLFSKG